MKKIVIKDCPECPFFHDNGVSYACKQFEYRVLFLDDSDDKVVIPEWCPLEDDK